MKEEEILVRLQLLEIKKEELNNCNTQKEQEELVKKRARKKAKILHPDVLKQKNKESQNVAKKNTQLMLEARDSLLKVIRQRKITFDLNHDDDIINLVNKKHNEKVMEDLINNFNKTPRTKEPKRKGKISNMVDKFNNGIDSVKDAITALKEKIKNNPKERER